MIQDVTENLTKEQPTEFQTEMLQHVQALVKMSRSKMSKYYSDWDMQNQVFHGEKWLDKEDVEQRTKGKPVKMVVPNTFAQVMTFSSFLFLMFNQNRTFFELTPTGVEDYGDKERDSETVLERDLRRNSWNTLLFQHLLDVGRFGPAPIECCWTRKLSRVYVPSQPSVFNYNGVEVEGRSGSEWKEYVKYEGNLIRNISPYRWFPDTRFPLVEFQRGEFCASEEEYSMVALRDLEASGEVAGVDHIRPLANNWEKDRGGITRMSIDLDQRMSGWLYGSGKSEKTALVTKVQVWIVPSKFTVDAKGEKKLGPEEFPVLYHVWYANDNRLIRCEPAYWWHNEFGWALSQFTPDMHETVSMGLADLIYRLQDVITWHINSRITDVRRNLRGRLIVDPRGVETSSLDSDGDIYLRESASKSGVDKWVKQLDTRDVTQAHMTDAELLGKLMQVVTGVNDNAMGQYNSGRRSAQEARVVTAGAAGRMKLHGHLIWDGALGPLGRMMLSNSRQSLPVEQFSRALGGPEESIQERYNAFKGTPEEVVCGDDYFIFDSTLSSEKGFMAQSLTELFSVIVQSDPVAAARVAQGVDPVKVVEEIQYLRGAGNLKRFRYSPEEQQQILAMQQQQVAAQQGAPAVSGDTHSPQLNIDRSTTVHVKPNGAK